MKRKSPSITSKLWSVSAIFSILILWQLSVSLGLVEGFMLPSPVQVAEAFIKEFPALMENARITLTEAGMGLVLGIATGFGAAVLMDRFDKAYKAFYPIIVLTQTVPAVAIAPLLVLWFGYEMTPKVILIVITTFFPITVVGAVISEWLGGFGGLGVYMTRVKKAFSFDKMFAVIFLISAISLILMWAVELLQKKCMPWETSQKQK